MNVVCKGKYVPCTEIDNPGINNNCLGYSLGSMLRTTPEGLRNALIKFLHLLKLESPDYCNLVSLSVLDDDSDNPYKDAVSELTNGCFIPADLFMAYCEYYKGKTNPCMQNCNVMFLIQHDKIYTPLCYFVENIAFPTIYIGGNGYHYKRVCIPLDQSVKLDLLFLNDVSCKHTPTPLPAAKSSSACTDSTTL